MITHDDLSTPLPIPASEPPEPTPWERENAGRNGPTPENQSCRPTNARGPSWSRGLDGQDEIDANAPAGPAT